VTRDEDDQEREARRRRAIARGSTVTIARLPFDAADAAPIRGAEAIALAAALTRAAWALGGHPFPRYERAATPCVFVPRGSTAPRGST
jgi:hypothetical protein